MLEPDILKQGDDSDGGLPVNGIPVEVSALTEIGAALPVGAPV